MQCIFCQAVIAHATLTYKGKDICSMCLMELSDIANNHYQGATYRQETLYAHCKECGKEFKDIVSPYPNDNSEYCYMCYWRMFARGNERQDRYACYGCNKTFFTAEPNWFEGKRYCYNCFCKIKVKRDEEAFESIFGKYRQQQYRTYSWDFAHEGDASGRSYFYRTSTSTNTSTSSISSAVREAFKVLGLAPGATAQDIKKAFRAKVKVAHDGNGGYKGDMDELVKAKETALEYAGS